MPGMSGIDMHTRLLDLGHALPTIFITALPSPDLKATVRAKGTLALALLEKPIDVSAGMQLTFKLVQNHGGWNSDDNQNHNLGRLRLSYTTTPDAEADPLPAAVFRVALSIPAAEHGQQAHRSKGSVSVPVPVANDAFSENPVLR